MYKMYEIFSKISEKTRKEVMYVRILRYLEDNHENYWQLADQLFGIDSVDILTIKLSHELILSNFINNMGIL